MQSSGSDSSARSTASAAVLPLVLSMVGLATLSTDWARLGGQWGSQWPWAQWLGWQQPVVMAVAALALLLFCGRLLLRFRDVRKEYAEVVPCSLYSGALMLTMILGSYAMAFAPLLGKALWLCGFIVHAVHTSLFTVNHVLRGVRVETFVPSWYVTYNGIMVAGVVGSAMHAPTILSGVLYYGIAAYLLILPFMLWRLARRPLAQPFVLTQAILLAPSSLCVAAYFNAVQTPPLPAVGGLYLLVVLTLVFVLIKLPAFLRQPFSPAYSALTFPMAIAVTASMQMSRLLTQQGDPALGSLVHWLSIGQLLLTTVIILGVICGIATLMLRALRRCAQ